MKTDSKREYPFANILREGMNRSHRRINLLNVISAAGFILAALVAIAALLF